MFSFYSIWFYCSSEIFRFSPLKLEPHDAPVPRHPCVPLRTWLKQKSSPRQVYSHSQHRIQYELRSTWHIKLYSIEFHDKNQKRTAQDAPPSLRACPCQRLSLISHPDHWSSSTELIVVVRCLCFPPREMILSRKGFMSSYLKGNVNFKSAPSPNLRPCLHKHGSKWIQIQFWTVPIFVSVYTGPDLFQIAFTLERIHSQVRPRFQHFHPNLITKQREICLDVPTVYIRPTRARIQMSTLWKAIPNRSR